MISDEKTDISHAMKPFVPTGRFYGGFLCAWGGYWRLKADFGRLDAKSGRFHRGHGGGQRGVGLSLKEAQPKFNMHIL